jgi:hypothetical protein
MKQRHKPQGYFSIVDKFIFAFPTNITTEYILNYIRTDYLLCRLSVFHLWHIQKPECPLRSFSLSIHPSVGTTQPENHLNFHETYWVKIFWWGPCFEIFAVYIFPWSWKFIIQNHTKWLLNKCYIQLNIFCYRRTKELGTDSGLHSNTHFLNLYLSQYHHELRGSVVVKALCCKPEGLEFKSRWGGFFKLT